MRGFCTLLLGAICLAPSACTGGEPANNNDQANMSEELGDQNPNAANAAANTAAHANASEAIWTSGGPDCPVETTNWTVTIRNEPGRGSMMRVIGYVRSTEAKKMAGAFHQVEQLRTTPPTQHFEIGPLMDYEIVNQAEQRFADVPVIPGLTAVVIDCNGKEIARVTKFRRERPGSIPQ